MSQQNQAVNADLPPVTQEDITRVLGPYCFIRLDNGDEAFFINGHFIGSAEGAQNDPPVYDIACLAARAAWQSLRCFELPVPAMSDWCWGDILEQLARKAPTGEVSGTVIVTCSEVKGRGVHFCNHPQLSGHNENLWFPVGAKESWFIAVERILVMNGLADKLLELNPLRDGDFSDFRATYSRTIIL
ncbi:hypothetical protein [Pantoea ananatis]|uniref:hypothetical protein n=1 Tax=Pantoea ananas TaxID=553 RepID=UPI001B304F82|nr:hypothetical protein [Pantoea ananatis]